MTQTLASKTGPSNPLPIQQRYKWVIFASLGLSYLLIFSQRTAPGIIANRLQMEFGVSSAVLGTMASVQFFLYMVLQVPVGFFADRFGPERLLISGMCLDGLGTLLFAQSHGFAWLLVGRAMVGMGDALIWVNIVLILGKWFSASEFAGMLGLTGTFGNIGALLATIPFAAWISVSGWRGPFSVLGLSLLLVAVLDLGLLNRTWLPWRRTASRPKQVLNIDPIPLGATLRAVVRSRLSWATFLCHFGVMGSYMGFTSLWAVPFFMDSYHLSRAGAAQFVLVAFVGAIVGGPIVGYLSDRSGERRRPYILLQVTATLAWCVVPLCGGCPPQWLLYVCLFVLGFGCGGSLLTFAAIRDFAPREQSGVSSGFANMGGFLSAVLLPVVFGIVIDAVNPTDATTLVSKSYQLAFLVPTFFSAFGILGSWLLPKARSSHT